MVLPLPHDFNHGNIERFQLGPRRELTIYLGVPMLPPGRVQGRLQWYDFGMHFSAIDNFDEVRAFFDSGEYRSVIVHLGYKTDEVSRIDRLVFAIMFEVATPPVLIIRCRNMALWQVIP